MKHEVTPAQIDEFRSLGFLAIEGFLDYAELDRWRSCVADAVALRLNSAGGLHNQADSSEYYSKVFTQALKLAEVHDGMRTLMHDPRLGKIASELSGADGIRIWHDQALIKPPFGNPTAWHLDNPYWSFTDRRSISIWVALDDATLGNGYMWYLPGTHLTAREQNAGISSNLDGLFEFYREWREIEPISCPCPAGSAVFHSGWVAHAAGANMTNKPRRAMTCAYMPDGAAFNGIQNVLPEEYYASLKVGDLLDSDNYLPLIYSNPRQG